MKIKIHQAYRLIVALADSDLIGERFEEGKLNIEVHKNFFDGDEKNEEEVIETLKDLVKEDATFNIVGESSIACALKAGIISKEGIFKIANVPVALVLL